VRTSAYSSTVHSAYVLVVASNRSNPAAGAIPTSRKSRASETQSAANSEQMPDAKPAGAGGFSHVEVANRTSKVCARGDRE
jgi:hypothetical protein